MASEFQVRISNTGKTAITGNFKEMQEELATMMQAYAGLEVTEENLPERKKDVATLRKIKTAIEDKRKAAKREYETPLKAFEAECKKLTALIDKEVDRITADMNVYEQKRIAAKRAHCAEIYEANIGGFAEYLPLEKVRKPTWDNKTCTDTEVLANIQEEIIHVKADVGVIESMCGEWREECLKVYKASGNNLTAALQRAKDLESAKQTAEAAVNGSEHTAQATPPQAPGKYRRTFTIVVNNEDDAFIIRGTCKACGFSYKEE